MTAWIFDPWHDEPSFIAAPDDGQPACKVPQPDWQPWTGRIPDGRIVPQPCAIACVRRRYYSVVLGCEATVYRADEDERRLLAALRAGEGVVVFFAALARMAPP